VASANGLSSVTHVQALHDLARPLVRSFSSYGRRILRVRHERGDGGGGVSNGIGTAAPELQQDPERIDSLDTLRGFAVLGILVMNVQSFSMPEAAYINPTAYGDLGGGNGWAWLLSHVLADGKFMTIFSMLFGAGILLFTERAASRGDAPARLHVRRMLWLVVFGLAHAYLLWYGDILVAYGICGLLVYPLRRLRPSRRLVLGLAVMAVTSCLALAQGRDWPRGRKMSAPNTWKRTGRPRRSTSTRK